ncbi:tetratricopeptide repeat protein, partial [Streptomyces sp. NPDC047999]|uniref:tetratricopeptide repeat protein n=1 Tax=Streptomyces sp. NPDC047999 TaxID=3365497 RepID=UPI0037139C01
MWPFKKQPAQQQAHQPEAVPGIEASGPRSVAIDTGGAFLGTVQTGDNATAIKLPPEALVPPAEIQAPPGLDNLPAHPALFVGRAHELERLDAALASQGRAVVQAVHGLGGIGKSTLAAHWAATRPHGHAPVRWITADTPAAVQQGLADLATALQPALARALTAEELAERAAQWLATHTGWLIILDNVNDPADIAALLARAPGGRFLITSRLATTWTDATTVVRLDVLDPDESLDLFTRITTAHNPGRDLDGAAELCEQLGHLPLAIKQAAAYLAQNPLTTPRTYLGLLAQYPAAMYHHGAATTPAERTIARIWNITLDRITHLQPAAADLLRTLAWYAPDHIPTTLLDTGPADPPTRNAALGLLTAYSMITPDPPTGTLAVHRLVQALARTPDPDAPHRTPTLIDHAREQATTQLDTALPDTWDAPATWPTWRTLLPHINALSSHAAENTDTNITARILNATGLFLNNQGQPASAIRHLQRALTGTVRVLGEDHPSTLASRNNLASAYESAGDLGRAIPLHEQTLTDRTRVLGEDHPDTLSSRNNLAGAYRAAGDLGRAIPMYEQTLTDMERVLGEDHPSTLTSRNNLASAYRAAGDLGRAIPLYEQTLTDMERVLGEDHPNTLTSRNNLASAYESAGDLSRAIPLYEQTLTDRTRVLGEDHPDTLTSRNNLASAYRAAGDLSRAIPLYEQTLTDMERVLGEDHPNTLTSRNNLAYAYESAGDLSRAIPLYEQTLTDRTRVLGKDHPDTLTSRNNLAGAYRAAGDLKRAIPLYEQTLTDMERVLGEDHPDTLTSR